MNFQVMAISAVEVAVQWTSPPVALTFARGVSRPRMALGFLEYAVFQSSPMYRRKLKS
jgi:hypothetical protein